MSDNKLSDNRISLTKRLFNSWVGSHTIINNTPKEKSSIIRCMEDAYEYQVPVVLLDYIHKVKTNLKELGNVYYDVGSSKLYGSKRIDDFIINWKNAVLTPTKFVFKGNIYHMEKGLLLDSDMNPLIIMTISAKKGGRQKVSESSFHSPRLHVSYSLLKDKTLGKYVKDYLIPLSMSFDASYYLSVNSIKMRKETDEKGMPVQIHDLSPFIVNANDFCMTDNADSQINKVLSEMKRLPIIV